MNLYQPTITGSLAVSGSVIINGPMTVVSGSLSGTASLASTASSADNFLVRNTLTAQTLVVQTVTSSVIYSSGSNVFGNNIANTQVFTGSVLITGSLDIIGGNLNIKTSNQQALLITSSNSTGFYTSYQSGSTLFGDIGNGSQVYAGGDVTAFGINARGDRKLQLGVAQTVVMTISGSTVSIGTASPDPGAPFTIEKTGAGLQTLTYFQNLQEAAANTGTSIYFLGTTGLNSLGRFVSAWEGASIANSYMSFWTRGSGTTSERLRINSSGYVGINNTNPASRLYVQTTAGATKAYDDTTKTNIMVFDDTSMAAGVGGSITFGGYKTAQTNGGNFAAIDGVKENGTAGNEAGTFRVWTANSSGVFSERMRITSTGDVLVGTTSSPSAYGKLIVRGTNAGVTIQSAADNNYRSIYSQSGNLYFYNGSNEGYLSTGGTWVNASDVTIKKDVKDIEYGLNEVMQLKPKWYKMIDDDLEQIGFIAQDVEEIIPELVSTSERGMKGLSYGQITAVLVKAIQELKADNDAIRAELAALKS